MSVLASAADVMATSALPEPSVLVFLLAAALFAGWIDAVSGGGGLVQLPALFIAFPQLPPVFLLATNKVASISGTGASAVTYARRVPIDKAAAAWLAGAAFVGSMAGAAVARLIAREAFDPIILAVLVIVGAYTVARPDLGSVAVPRVQGRRHVITVVLIGLIIGFYDGALGPGTGSFFVIALVAAAGYAFLAASAHAKIANVATNAAALVVFIPAGAVMWPTALLMAAANMLGGYVGARMATARGSRFVRFVFVLVISALALRLAWGMVVGGG